MNAGAPEPQSGRLSTTYTYIYLVNFVGGQYNDTVGLGLHN